MKLPGNRMVVRDIDIEWDDAPALLVADVSHRPVEVEITGIGLFDVSGLSRVGWDIEVFEFASSGDRTNKEPGAIVYPEVAMLYLRSSVAEVAALAAWTESPVPQSMTMTLEGIGGERVQVHLYGVLPVSAGTEVFSIDFSDDVEMGGVRIQFDDIDLAEYTGTFIDIRDWGKPEPGQWVEIAGVDAGRAYDLGVLDPPVAGSNPAFWFPSVRGGEQIFDWAEDTVSYVEVFGSKIPKDVSIANIDEYGMEINRINIFFCWPAGINIFNPGKPYGQNFLIDVFVVGEWVEDA